MATIGRVLLMPKGDYNGTTVYNNLDWVRYNGIAWVCKVDGTVGVVPDVTASEWQVLAQDGSVSGSVNWSSINNKPFDDIAVDGGLDVDGSNNLILDTSYLTSDNISYDNTSSGLTASDVQDAIDELANGSTDVSWNQIQTSSGATKIAEITIDGSKTNVYAPTGGGGGASSLDDLSDVSIDTQTLDDGQILAYNLTDQEFQNVDMPQGGHTMISNSGYESTMATHALDDTDDDVASAYVIANWSNCDAKVVLTTVAQDADGVGDWNDTWLTDNDRTGWLWSKEFYRILEDGNGNTVTDIEVLPVFDGGKSETVSLYAYRIDDNVTVNGVNGGAVAFKLNGAIKTAGGLKIGLKLVHQRTNVSDGTIIT